jgi:hypothetical protein
LGLCRNTRAENVRHASGDVEGNAVILAGQFDVEEARDARRPITHTTQKTASIQR